MARHDRSKSRITPKGTTSTPPAGPSTGDPAGRPAARAPISGPGPSPTWVPVMMFALLVIGVLVILLNYVAPIPGAPSNWYLLAGLAAVLAGIIAATQYR